MGALPVTSVTETPLGKSSKGIRCVNVKVICTGTGAGAEVAAAITIPGFKKIIGTPNFAMMHNAGTILYIVSTSVAANVVTVTVNTDVGAVAVWFVGEVWGY